VSLLREVSLSLATVFKFKLILSETTEKSTFTFKMSCPQDISIFVRGQEMQVRLPISLPPRFSTIPEAS
jgi:hypothetical protein